MDNNLRNVEKMLRCFAKKCKDLKYTRGLLFSFLMSGTVAQAVEKKNSDDSIESTKKTACKFNWRYEAAFQGS